MVKVTNILNNGALLRITSHLKKDVLVILKTIFYTFFEVPATTFEACFVRYLSFRDFTSLSVSI